MIFNRSLDLAINDYETEPNALNFKTLLNRINGSRRRAKDFKNDFTDTMNNWYPDAFVFDGRRHVTAGFAPKWVPIGNIGSAKVFGTKDSTFLGTEYVGTRLAIPWSDQFDGNFILIWTLIYIKSVMCNLFRATLWSDDECSVQVKLGASLPTNSVKWLTAR